MLKTDSHTAANELRLGDYAGSVSALGTGWPGIGKVPSRNGRSDGDYARLLMVCGLLTIKLGNANQQLVQEAAKDMLTMSVRLFRDNPERQEARLGLGVIYLHSGEYNEAMLLAEVLLAEDTNVDVVFDATQTKAIAEGGLGKNTEALATLGSIAMLLDVVPVFSQGKFYLNRGMAKRNLGQTIEAVEDYNQAADLFELTSAVRWEAATSNNLAGAYLDLGYFLLAHNFAERAITLFKNLKDIAHEAKSWDQDARIFLAEENFMMAERCAGNAVMLYAGDNHAWRAEALITHGVVLSRLGYQQATAKLTEAAQVCETIGSLEQAQQAYSELWKATRHARRMAESINETVKPIERVVITKVMEKYGGRVTKAATELDINHSALTKKVKQLGLERSPKRKSPRGH